VTFGNKLDKCVQSSLAPQAQSHKTPPQNRSPYVIVRTYFLVVRTLYGDRVQHDEYGCALFRPLQQGSLVGEDSAPIRAVVLGLETTRASTTTMDNSVPRDEYILNLKFRNSLPSAPSGPFLKNVNLAHTFDEFPEYCTSTLEKNYICQPHFGPDLGIKLDLVDQEAILAQDKAGFLDQSDLKYLSTVADKGRGKAKHIDESDKPWWLRNTTYMENNLYNVAKVKSKTAIASEVISAKRPALDYDRDMLTTSFINDSFDLVSKTVSSLIAKNGTSKLVSDLPLVPIDGDVLNGIQFTDRLHSLVRFDEDPVVSTHPGKGEASHTSKRRRVDSGLITNLRQTAKSEELRNEVLEVSLVSPLAAHPATSTQSQSQLTEEAGAESGVHYGWVKDYRMNVQHIQLQDSFLFVVQRDASEGHSSNNGSNSGSADSDGSKQAEHYFPVRARVDMHKMNPEDSRPHDCVVLKE
jgi:hypothetical protein